MSEVVTGETWIFNCDHETGEQSLKWVEKGWVWAYEIEKACKFRLKTMSIVFLDIRGIIRREWIPSERIAPY